MLNHIAQVFTDKRYALKDIEFFPVKFMEFIKKQGFLLSFHQKNACNYTIVYQGSTMDSNTNTPSAATSTKRHHKPGKYYLSCRELIKSIPFQ